MADPDFNDATETGAGTNIWFIDVDADTTRDKDDMILYTRSDFAVAGPSVECASCHDPHSDNNTFLRRQNTASAVCLACHDK